MKKKKVYNIAKKVEKNIPGIPQITPELDFTTTGVSGYWCQRYGGTHTETTSGSTTTHTYSAKPTNLGKAFKFKVRYDYEVKTSGLSSGQTEGLYCKSRIIHCDSVGKVWWVEEEVEEQIFETTLHEHS